MDLAITALQRDVLDDYGTYQVIHGVRVPNWLIVDGADASSEAVLGLAAYVTAAGDRAARTALRQLAARYRRDVRRVHHQLALPGAAALGALPFRSGTPGARTCRPHSPRPAGCWVTSPCSQTAVDDAAGFSPQLLTSTGPVNGLLPTPSDSTQIAYGADARVQGLVAVGAADRPPGIRTVGRASRQAGSSARTPAGVPVYDPATGVTNDGVQPRRTSTATPEPNRPFTVC